MTPKQLKKAREILDNIKMLTSYTQNHQEELRQHALLEKQAPAVKFKALMEDLTLAVEKGEREPDTRGDAILTIDLSAILEAHQEFVTFLANQN